MRGRRARASAEPPRVPFSSRARAPRCFAGLTVEELSDDAPAESAHGEAKGARGPDRFDERARARETAYGEGEAKGGAESKGASGRPSSASDDEAARAPSARDAVARVAGGKPPSEMSLKELRAAAAALGVPVASFVEKRDFVEAVEQRLAAASPRAPAVASAKPRAEPAAGGGARGGAAENGGAKALGGGGGRPRPEPNGVFLKLSVVDEDRPDEAGRYIEVDEGASRDFTTRNLKVLVGMELGYSTAEMKARALHHDGAALHDDAPLSELDLRSGDTLTVVGT